MFHLKTLPALARARAGAGVPLKRRTLPSSRGHRSGTPSAAPRTEQKDGAARDARTERPPQPADGVTGSSTAANEVSVDFDRTREAYKSKDSLELLRSLVVFKLCSYDFLVDKNKEIMDLGKRILGQKAFEQIMKMTFYGQFVAGEDHRAIRPLIQKNRAFGVGSVLDYGVEEDLSQEEAEQKDEEYDACVSERWKRCRMERDEPVSPVCE